MMNPVPAAPLALFGPPLIVTATMAGSALAMIAAMSLVGPIWVDGRAGAVGVGATTRVTVVLDVLVPTAHTTPPATSAPINAPISAPTSAEGTPPGGVDDREPGGTGGGGCTPPGSVWPPRSEGSDAAGIAQRRAG